MMPIYLLLESQYSLYSAFTFNLGLQPYYIQYVCAIPPRQYKGLYTAQRANGHLSIDLLVIAQQPQCCPHSNPWYQHAFLSSEWGCMCEDKA